MKAPPRLQSLVEEGLIDTVVRQLMSGKEAMVFVVRSGEQTLCAKIYKEANNRSFRQAVDYTENRKVKNSRSARAMAKGSKFGRQEQEAAWQSAEVDALYRLAAAGVRVPQPYNFHDGVLLMELVTDANGDAAPRLNDVAFTPEQALQHHATLIGEVVRMLCAGVVHGDLSEFNILLANADALADALGIDIELAQPHIGHAQLLSVGLGLGGCIVGADRKALGLDHSEGAPVAVAQHVVGVGHRRRVAQDGRPGTAEVTREDDDPLLATVVILDAQPDHRRPEDVAGVHERGVDARRHLEFEIAACERDADEAALVR